MAGASVEIRAEVSAPGICSGISRFPGRAIEERSQVRQSRLRMDPCKATAAAQRGVYEADVSVATAPRATMAFRSALTEQYSS
jgi:hypothetical protein